ncbi:MAG TPA: hypothetical protein VNW94_05985 [Streptosporangiaceae bacterium]|nr:hypothetical protein [Streptosporangiaceae bacterium]
MDRRRKDHGAMGEFLKGVRRYLSPEKKVPRRRDFVGRMCVIRTGRVDERFGQAEVRAEDGSVALIEVRNQSATDHLKAGSSALIFEYDDDGRFFWVMPYDAALDPHRKD